MFAEQLVAWIEESGEDDDLTAVPATIEALLALDRLDPTSVRCSSAGRSSGESSGGERWPPFRLRRAGRGEPPPDVAGAEGPRSTCAFRPPPRGRPSLPSRAHPRRRLLRHPEVGAGRPARAGCRLAGEASRRAQRGCRLPPRASARLPLRARACGPGRAEARRGGWRTAWARRGARARPRRLEGRDEPPGPRDIATAGRRGVPSRTARRARRRISAGRRPDERHEVLLVAIDEAHSVGDRRLSLRAELQYRPCG